MKGARPTMNQWRCVEAKAKAFCFMAPRLA